MMAGNIAQLYFDNRTQKWVAIYGGNVLASSPKKEYVVKMITNNMCNKARAVNVTDVREVGAGILNADEDDADSQLPEQQVVDRFSINERFDFMTDFVNMVAEGTSPSLLVSGEGGLGKTHTVRAALESNGLQNLPPLSDIPEGMIIDDKKFYVTVKGYSTAKGLYRTLWENRNRNILFDDCDSILKIPDAINILKGALDSYDKRIISWNAESFGDDDLPRSFEFKGGIIFISNLPLIRIDQAVRSRAICVDLSMNIDQKIERMEAIIENDEFLPSYTKKVKRAALDFIEEKKLEVRELNFRSLISVTKVVGRGDDWKKKAEYLLTSGT